MYVPGLSRTELPEKMAQGRTLYPDRELALLPDLNGDHPRHQEWAGRAASCRNLVRYLSHHKRGADILDIGCGNGWLSHRLSAVPGSRVIGLDPNLIELRQAARVFHRQLNLKFIYGDFYSTVLQDLSFDIIVLAATIQYFNPPQKIIRDALTYLRPRGEIHLIDSCLYRPALQGFTHRYLYDPRSFWDRLSRRGGDHAWVCITKRS